MRLIRHFFGWSLLSVVAAIIFHKRIDVAGLVFGGVVLIAVLIYALIYAAAPTAIDPETGRPAPDKAPIPELLNARRRRRQDRG